MDMRPQALETTVSTAKGRVELSIETTRVLYERIKEDDQLSETAKEMSYADAEIPASELDRLLEVLREWLDSTPPEKLSSNLMMELRTLYEALS